MTNNQQDIVAIAQYSVCPPAQGPLIFCDPTMVATAHTQKPRWCWLVCSQHEDGEDDDHKHHTSGGGDAAVPLIGGSALPPFSSLMSSQPDGVAA